MEFEPDQENKLFQLALGYPVSIAWSSSMFQFGTVLKDGIWRLLDQNITNKWVLPTKGAQYHSFFTTVKKESRDNFCVH